MPGDPIVVKTATLPATGVALDSRPRTPSGLSDNGSVHPAFIKQPTTLHPPASAPASPPRRRTLRDAVDQVTWFSHVLYLFTKTDIHNLVLPGCTMAAVTHVAYLHQTHASLLDVTLTVLRSFLWGYLGLLVIDVTNQLVGMDEDRANKPFRPLVAGLITPRAAMRLSVIATFAFVLTAHVQGVLWCALAFVAATCTYNFTGADTHWVGKNLCNAWGYGCYFAAGGWLAHADIVKLGGADPAYVAATVQAQVALHMVAIFATITVQDLRDVDGDLMTGRVTQNIAWGEWNARVAVVAGMVATTAAAHARVALPWAWWFVHDVLGWAGETSHPGTKAADAEGWARAVFYSVLWTLVAWVSVRILRDCPEYRIEGGVSVLVDAKRDAARLGIAAGELNDSGAADVVKVPDLHKQIKRAQYERDDFSFKLHILWLYLYIFTAVF
ncbi:hypothetical protein GGF31_008908 [Allomyces arbusculus]|nr:hypothetical protein GGF31_008908 [Allomyces arbusculus]